MSSGRKRPPGTAQRSLADAVIECAWLAALILTPLAFAARESLIFWEQPKQVVLHAAALTIAVAWAFEYAAGLRPEVFPTASVGMLRRRKALVTWALVAAGALAASAAASTAASPAPAVSLWGRDFGRLGFELYTTLSLLIVFFAIAVRLRSRTQALRALGAIAGAGALASLYGVAQHFHWDGLGPGAGLARVYSTFGNPIFLGAYLVMSVPATLALLLARPRARAWWWCGGAALIGAQLAAMWFTGSRGPWLGLAIGLVAWLATAAMWLDRRTLLTGLALLAAGGLIALGIDRVPSAPPRDAGRSLADATSVSRALAEVGAVSFGIGGPSDRGGRATRGEVWRGALELAGSWERYPPEGSITRALRPALGFGPEMYHYSYPLSAGPADVFEVMEHPHNALLQVLMEQGVLGLSAFAAVVGLVALAALGLLRGERVSGRSGAFLPVVASGLLAALAGRGVEQMAGVARIGDLLPFWALAGLVVGLARLTLFAAPGRASPQPGPPRHGPASLSPWVWRTSMAAAGLFAVASLYVFFVQDVQHLRSGRLAAGAREALQDGDGPRALGLYSRAAGLTPDVALYSLRVHELLFDRVQSERSPALARGYLREGYDALARYESRDPFNIAVQQRLARAALDLYQAGDLDRDSEVVARYYRLAQMLPPYPDVQALCAHGLLVGGAPGLAVQAADRAIAMEPMTHEVPRAWWARGQALALIGQTDAAVESLRAAIERDPDGEWGARAHDSLARELEQAGQAEEAERHRADAERIRQAMAGEWGAGPPGRASGGGSP